MSKYSRGLPFEKNPACDDGTSVCSEKCSHASSFLSGVHLSTEDAYVFVVHFEQGFAFACDVQRL